MRAPNHIAGGIVFTGIFCSFWNINIFSNGWYFGLTVFASLLPDIDHSNSMLGRAVPPLSRYLHKNFGHRTITHSLVFFVATLGAVYLINSFFIKSVGVVYIFGFALFSHLLFDMLTLQGVPLFYPWLKNPCVIPANPDLRLKGSFSSELVVFSIFGFLTYFCMPLFANGFWMSYNRNFNTLQHLHSTYVKTKKVLEVDYSYSLLSDVQNGKGLLVYSGSNEAYLYDSLNGLVHIESIAIIHQLQPTLTDFYHEYNEHSFSNISLDSLNILFDGLIIEATIFSSEQFKMIDGKTLDYSDRFKIEWIDKPKFDVFMNTDFTQLEQKQLELNHLKKLRQLDRKYKKQLEEKINFISQELEANKLSDYKKGNYISQLQDAKRELENHKIDETRIEKLQTEINYIESKHTKSQYFSGSVKSYAIQNPHAQNPPS